ncbi:MAG TPA: ubiquitin-like small modifier protein 1 [Thermomicrobiales bacterium]|nr:ubiquitin-like small modifier protein 1 [Thermomicrobiales bacterium]
MSEASAIQILVPTPLRRYTNGEAKVGASGATVGEVLTDLDARYPGLKERVCDPDGEIRRFVNVFVNGENVRKLQGAATPLKGGDEVGIIPAMAGGA